MKCFKSFLTLFAMCSTISKYSLPMKLLIDTAHSSIQPMKLLIDTAHSTHEAAH
jgi:hypothetical protein